MRYLAIDPGQRRIGMAISDDSGALATPYGTRERRNNRADVEAIVETARGLGAEGIVVGLPRNPQGGLSESEELARVLAAQLEKALHKAKFYIPVELWNESFSTVEAHSRMRALDISQKQGRESRGSHSTDAIAASIILQSYLDSLRDTSLDGDRIDEDESPAEAALAEAHGDETQNDFSPKDLF